MRISVNLANRPFIELRPLFAKLRLAMVVLALLAVGLWFALHSLNAKARVAQAQMAALKAKTQRYQQERMANEARMRQPQNMAVLERSRFLNAAFAEKSFSWTAVMMDLEKVLPAGVQVTSIDPVISKEGDVNIRLRVSGDREKAVQLVRNLETSQRFLSPRLASEQAQTQEGNRNAAQLTAPGAVQFDVLSGYNPLPEKPVKAVAAKDKKDKKDKGDATEGDTGAVKKKRTTPKSALPGAGAVKAPAQKGAAR
ncbi:PilN domain-containing protein [Tunturiibacter gelidoferens]|jgi:type IV pilus assembly protein PilN|uniref:Type IV pilus assembly protein PilN n=1 Tax=Tunturiibacter gelidiferens TaxID=3069689 RepID=A0A9X0QGC5_9BACT|nr:PilN domain-containing protein [Edaphobacter lichenicola]MBB5329913.1 type IV pilus assembly protein PilN [Edaphobacter lichenicola]